LLFLYNNKDDAEGLFTNSFVLCHELQITHLSARANLLLHINKIAKCKHQT